MIRYVETIVTFNEVHNRSVTSNENEPKRILNKNKDKILVTQYRYLKFFKTNNNRKPSK